MKTLKSLIWLSTVLLIFLCGCQSSNEISDSVVKEFINKLYIIEDYNSIDVQQLIREYPNDKYSQDLKKILTESAFQDVINNKFQISFIQKVNTLHAYTQLKDIKVEKYKTENDSIVYNYSAKVKLIFIDTNKESEKDISGQVTVKKIDTKWMIDFVNDVNHQDIYKLNP